MATINLLPGDGTVLYNISLDGTVEEEEIPTQVNYGDLNEDGVINSLDAARLIRYILEIDDPYGTPPKPPAVWIPADLNGDGVINSIDYTILHRYILEIISYFPVNPPGEYVIH
ncbi:MAG TPA: hypothetical protein GX727_03060 [Clostridium sp.]|nr:hypothetical protein [Clostridium sp.]